MDLFKLLKTGAPKKTTNLTNLIPTSDIDGEEIVISDTYTDNYDIRTIHRRIMKRFEYLSTHEIPKLEKERASLLDIVSKIRKPTQKFVYYDKISMIEKKIEDYKEGITMNSYRTLTEPHLNVFYQTFSSKEYNEVERRITAIEEFIDIASNYAKLDIRRILPEYHLCEVCGYDLLDVYSDENHIVCPGCSTITSKFVETSDGSKTADYSNATASSSSVRGEDPRNFKEALKRFQGKEKVQIPDSLYVDLDNYFTGKCKPPGSYFRSMAPTANGSKIGTSKAMLHDALKYTNHSALHNNVALICKLYWGWELLDLSQYEDTILRYYAKFQECYESKKGDGRKSSLSTQVLLWLILYNLDIPCSSSDFKTVEVSDTVSYYNQILSECTSELGWKNIQL